MEFTLEELAEATGGRVVGDARGVAGVGIDTRVLVPGSLFVALVADRDGHEYLAAAAERGAAAALVRDAGRLPEGLPAVVVEDTDVALADLGRLARDRVPGERVVGVTGSVGKTSVKDLAAAALRGEHSVHASERSFNNELGVPLTLANAPAGVEVLVVEMGARGHGHVADLCTIARPTVGVVTAVGAAHIEQFGTLDDIARAKGELIESLPTDGTAVLNADDERVHAMADRSAARVLTYGVERGAVRAADVDLDHELRPSFTLHSPWGRAEVKLAARGVHNVSNAAGAAAIALALGAPLESVAEGFTDAELSPWRMEVARTPTGALVINDAYNANPTSVRAALESLAAVPADRRVAVLGLMAELGPDSPTAHEEVGATARERGIEVVAVAAPGYGGTVVADEAEAEASLGDLGPGDAVLVKGSRVAGLERLAHRLMAGG